MPIQINQKFPRCQLCGKLIPLRAEPKTVRLVDGKVASFCSEECRQEYWQRLESSELVGGLQGARLSVDP